MCRGNMGKGVSPTEETLLTDPDAGAGGEGPRSLVGWTVRALGHVGRGRGDVHTGRRLPSLSAVGCGLRDRRTGLGSAAGRAQTAQSEPCPVGLHSLGFPSVTWG